MYFGRTREAPHHPPAIVYCFVWMNQQGSIAMRPAVESENQLERLSLSFGRWLRGVRTEQGLSQESVASAAGVDVSTYARLERAVGGNRWANPRLRTVLRVLAALHVDPACLEPLGGNADRRGLPPASACPRVAHVEHADNVDRPIESSAEEQR